MSALHTRFTVLYATLTACALVLAASACGGGGGATSTVSPPPPPPADNVVSVVVDQGPAAATGVVNTPYVSVTICAHGTTNCQTIDHVTVDTGSYGVRLISSVVSSTVAAALTQVTDSQSQPLVECTQFADGYSWGPVKLADIKIGGELAAGVPVQMIGDPAFSTVPPNCSSTGPQEDTVAQFGGNGILGIGVFKQDCGAGCAAGPVSPALYYACPASGCVPSAAPLASQVSNPVFLFPTDNNGSILELPTVGASGAAILTGSLIFGIDTESNNALGTAAIVSVDSSTGYSSATFNSQTLAHSFIDSGSNAYFFPDASLTVCTSSVAKDFYCPATTQPLSATIAGPGGLMQSVSLNVANAVSLLNDNPTFSVFSNLGGTNPDTASFDFGLPFFMGRHVFTAIEGQSTSAGAGPYMAF